MIFILIYYYQFFFMRLLPVQCPCDDKGETCQRVLGSFRNLLHT